MAAVVATMVVAVVVAAVVVVAEEVLHPKPLGKMCSMQPFMTDG